MGRPLFLRWIPWKFILRRAARSQGLLDPILLLSRLARFGRLGEVGTPGDLLRAGALLHARGLVNNQAIQHNLDWVWPHWVERQFDPRSESFIPRAFSLTHINLTHRNWTAAGFPGCPETPIVDPAGLVTPLFDGWSIDAWVVAHDGEALVPSRLQSVGQRLEGLDREGSFRVVTSARQGDLELESSLRVEGGGEHSGAGHPVEGAAARAVVVYEARSVRPVWLAVGLRPYNPEGVSFIHSLKVEAGGSFWRINETDGVWLSEAPERIRLSEYAEGEVFHRLLYPAEAERASAGGQQEPRRREVYSPAAGSLAPYESLHPEAMSAVAAEELEPPADPVHGTEVTCPVGMATGLALFGLPTGRRCVEVSVPLGVSSRSGPPARPGRAAAPLGTPAADRGREADRAWSRALEAACRLEAPDEQEVRLYEAALRTLLIHTPGEVYAGPYTYKRCWIRDSVMILNALVCANLGGRARGLLPALFDRQKASGYFFSHDGEWDANGEVLWLLDRLRRFSGDPAPEGWRRPLRRAADWIVRKRLPDGSGEPHAGLLPPGFSAEHLGPNDYYYWDDFWSAAGLESAARLARELGLPDKSEGYAAEAGKLLEAVERSLETASVRLGRPVMPASPYRRMDTGAVGSLAGGYPLQLLPARDARLLNTAEYLLDHSLVRGGLFHDMSHSGINPYLTLHLAQVLLRAGDPRFEGLVAAVAALASPTGQWPEAVHPGTGGGCMGDGQHVWAAAEWVLMLRNRLVREEGQRLVLCAGIPSRWLHKDAGVAWEPAPTAFGPLSLALEPGRRRIRLRCRAQWHDRPPTLQVRLPGFEALDVEGGDGEMLLELRRLR